MGESSAGVICFAFGFVRISPSMVTEPALMMVKNVGMIKKQPQKT